jgi:hypothetical protein
VEDLIHVNAVINASNTLGVGHPVPSTLDLQSDVSEMSTVSGRVKQQTKSAAMTKSSEKQFIPAIPVRKQLTKQIMPKPLQAREGLTQRRSAGVVVKATLSTGANYIVVTYRG